MGPVASSSGDSQHPAGYDGRWAATRQIRQLEMRPNMSGAREYWGVGRTVTDASKSPAGQPMIHTTPARCVTRSACRTSRAQLAAIVRRRRPARSIRALAVTLQQTGIQTLARTVGTLDGQLETKSSAPSKRSTAYPPSGSNAAGAAFRRRQRSAGGERRWSIRSKRWAQGSTGADFPVGGSSGMRTNQMWRASTFTADFRGRVQGAQIFCRPMVMRRGTSAR